MCVTENFRRREDPIKLGFDFECVISILLVVSNTRRVNSTRENLKPDISALLPPLF